MPLDDFKLEKIDFQPAEFEMQDLHTISQEPKGRNSLDDFKASLPDQVSIALGIVKRRKGIEVALVPPQASAPYLNGDEPVLSAFGFNGSTVYYLSVGTRMLTFKPDGEIFYGTRGGAPEGSFHPENLSDPEDKIIDLGDAISYLLEQGEFTPQNNKR